MFSFASILTLTVLTASSLAIPLAPAAISPTSQSNDLEFTPGLTPPVATLNDNFAMVQDEISDGFATFFFQNGVAGACGKVHGDGELIAAIDSRRYGNTSVKSPLCGQRVKITNPENLRSVTVTIVDACPTCENADSLDLSTGAFKQIADLGQGIIPIVWEFV